MLFETVINDAFIKLKGPERYEEFKKFIDSKGQLTRIRVEFPQTIRDFNPLRAVALIVRIDRKHKKEVAAHPAIRKIYYGKIPRSTVRGYCKCLQRAADIWHHYLKSDGAHKYVIIVANKRSNEVIKNAVAGILDRPSDPAEKTPAKTAAK